MTTIRNLLVGLIGGSELMWDVCLGVLIALLIVGIVKVIVEIVVRGL